MFYGAPAFGQPVMMDPSGGYGSNGKGFGKQRSDTRPSNGTCNEVTRTGP